ncbi:hypothetical protein [Desulfosporosinus metallidurans]|uniref:Uncharacterized protein n=1 Tax=Desulfosporosinus metallidurans TaxID=1888891 RepID=A0A1Q8QFY4_9FIRM|nr:hypothetical protein [Desulfosporosinus metallidurans]OLN26244.1 hypothetical protein DSOL_5072 [Desulfosporosinus metallidurans]
MEYIEGSPKNEIESKALEHFLEINKNNNTIKMKVSDSNIYIYPNDLHNGVVALCLENLRALYDDEKSKTTNDDRFMDYEIDGVVYKVQFVGFKELESIQPYGYYEKLEGNSG